MLLPVPQGKASDTLKPIIEFLGEGNQENTRSRNAKSRGDNLPIPKDSQPGKTVNSNSKSQNNISPSKFPKQTVVSSSVSEAQGLSPNTPTTAIILGSSTPKNENGNVKTAVNSQVVSTLANETREPSLDGTEQLVKSFLNSKFGKTIANSFTSLGELSNVSHKKLMEKYFESNVKPTSTPPTENPPNKHLITNLISGLMSQPDHETAGKMGSEVKNQDVNEISTGVKVSADGTNKLSSPTISIGNRVFSLDALANALNENNGNEVHTQNTASKVDSTIIGLINGSRKQSVRLKNRSEKLKQLSEKISTLETLSDALDALTVKLSSDEKPESNQEDQLGRVSTSEVNNKDSERQKNHRTRHHHHHRHHIQDNVFDEDVEMLGSLLSKDYNQLHSEQTPHDRGSLSTTVDSELQKLLSSRDLELLQNKVNKAIEISESMGKGNDAKQSISKWLPLLFAGKGVQDEEAHTREEVTTVQGNHSNPPGATIGFNNGETHSLKDILFTLIDSALKKGTLNYLVQRWNRTGSPFTKIAQNVSLFLQSKNIPKTPLPRQDNRTTKSVSTTISSLASQFSKGISSLDQSFPADKINFSKAINNFLRVLAKREGFQKQNSTRDSKFVTTDTLTNFTGVVLGGRINKIDPQEEFIAKLGSQIVDEILRDQANHDKGRRVNANKLERLVETQHRNKNNTAKNDSKTVSDSHVKIPEETSKHKFSIYDTNDEPTIIRNDTFEGFMNSISIGNGAHNPNPEEIKTGDKYSKVKPKLSDLMSAISTSLLNTASTDQNSLPNKKLTFRIDDSGNETLLHRLPNDHKLSDYSLADVVLEAPNDRHILKTNSSVRRPAQHSLAPSSSASMLPGKIASDLNKKNNTYNQNDDLSDQTVTLTLETVDDTPPSAQLHFREQAKEQTAFRSTKVPHDLNIQASTTLGKINSTFSKDVEHFFHENDTPTVSELTSADTKVPSLTTSASLETGVVSQTKAFTNQLPLGLEMNAIGRIGDTDGHGSLGNADSSIGLVSDKLGSESAQTKSFKEKVLPVVSDLTPANGVRTEGETELISSKTGSSPSAMKTAIKITPHRELPTASEVREITSSIKALLKIMNNYYKRLKSEDDESGSGSEGILSNRSHTANNEKINNITTPKVYSSSLQQEPPKTSLPNIKFGTKNPYIDFPQSSPLLPSTLDNGGFENIQEQPITDQTTSSYNWNFRPTHAHVQSPLDSSPTKTSLQPELGIDSAWIPGNEVSRVGEELKELNFPSIEDDPTVRAVQSIVAEDNMLANQKRKAIQKHEQQSSKIKGHPKTKPMGIFGRNTIPQNKIKGHHQSKFHGEQHVAISGKHKNRRKTNKYGRGRNEIPRVPSNSKQLSRPSKLGIPKNKNLLSLGERSIYNKTNQTRRTYLQNSTGEHRMIKNQSINKIIKDKLRLSRDHRNPLNTPRRFKDNNRDTRVKNKNTFNKDLGPVKTNTTKKNVMKVVKIKQQRDKVGVLSQGSKRSDAGNISTSADEAREMKVKKDKQVLHLEN